MDFFIAFFCGCGLAAVAVHIDCVMSTDDNYKIGIFSPRWNSHLEASSAVVIWVRYLGRGGVNECKVVGLGLRLSVDLECTSIMRN